MCKHHCAECGNKMIYRLVRGTSFEGISLREIYLNAKDEIVGWDDEPTLTLAGSKDEVIEAIVGAMHDLDDMLVATKQPILDEAELEANLAK